MKFRIASDISNAGPLKWDVSEVLHVTPGDDFEEAVKEFADAIEADAGLKPNAALSKEAQEWLASLRTQAAGKLQRRLGWMTRAHPFILDNKRLIVPLYSDGFSFSLMAITDDWGATWKVSNPLIGAGNIQPSIVKRKDGSLVAFMRDNGPAPKRLHESESRDGGVTWSAPRDSPLPNPGSGAEIISLKNGRWLLISNDTEKGRHSLAVQMSDDEGKTWKWKRRLEHDPTRANSYHYPSIIEARDGTLHASYSYHLGKADAMDGQGRPKRKAIKDAHFNEAWVMQGD
jgi:Neuraminidase (sialidase)